MVFLSDAIHAGFKYSVTKLCGDVVMWSETIEKENWVHKESEIFANVIYEWPLYRQLQFSCWYVMLLKTGAT